MRGEIELVRDVTSVDLRRFRGGRLDTLDEYDDMDKLLRARVAVEGPAGFWNEGHRTHGSTPGFRMVQTNAQSEHRTYSQWSTQGCLTSRTFRMVGSWSWSTAALRSDIRGVRQKACSGSLAGRSGIMSRHGTCPLDAGRRLRVFQTMRLIPRRPCPARLAVVTLLIPGICIVSVAAAIRIVSPVHPRTIERHVAFLADDLLEGRKAGTRGYDLAAAYVAAQFRGFGLTSLTPDSYLQRVRFRTITARSATLAVRKGTRDVVLSLGDDFLLWGDPTAASADVSGEMIFIAYGIAAPELDHDDYKGVDGRGKILVFLSGVPLSFPAEASDYHSSPDLKDRVAQAKGAKAVVEVLTPPGDLLTPVGDKDWARYRAFAEREGRIVWLDKDGTPDGPGLGLTLSTPGWRKLKTLVGTGTGISAAEWGGVQGTISYESVHTEFTSANVVAVLTGRDPTLRREAVVYTAHLDHLGIGEPVDGDTIYNGAVDNASGVAALLGVAEKFSERDERPLRSVVFVATTAEEPGLLGSDYFIRHLPEGIQRVVAAINIDGATLMQYPLREVIARGGKNSSLGQVAQEAAAAVGLKAVSEWLPPNGSYHWPLARCGVPSLWAEARGETEDHKARDAAWMKDRYHTPKDDLTQPLNYNSGAAFADFNAELGWRLAQGRVVPIWNHRDTLLMPLGNQVAVATQRCW